MRRPSRPRTTKAAARAVTPAEPSPDYLRALYDRTTLGIALLDHAGAIVHANAALTHLLGQEPAAVAGSVLANFCPPEDAELVRARSSLAHGAQGAATLDARFVRPDGTILWGLLSISPADVDDRVRFTAILQDLTERKAHEAHLVHQAYHDPLTSLANRELFRERVSHAIASRERDPSTLAVMLLDLDHFKNINDTQGHSVGDRMLQVVARRLKSATRGCDTVARLGGDEFAILVEHVDARSGAETVAERVVAALREPVAIDGTRALITGGSIGIAVYTGIETTDELLRNADVAMYESKLHAPGRCVVFDPSMHTALIERVTLEADLRQALERSQLLERPRLEETGVYRAYEPRPAVSTEFAVAYQPIVDLVTGQVSSVEALARWAHPQRGDVSPEVFIPAAEQCGLIAVLGRWVLREACRQGAAWNRDRAGPAITVTVNLSAKQLAHDELVSELESILHETGLEPRRLILEITETAIMQNAEATLARLQRIKQLGVGLAIDDFGTGYSSLSYLQRFPVDVVKIDRVFTSRLRTNGDGAEVIRTILALADLLDLRTIAEGVEEASQLDELRALGCDAVQGFLYGQPLTASEVEQVFAAGAAPR